MEKLHHHGGDLDHKGRVDVSGDMTRHDEERLYQLISNHVALHRLDPRQGDPRQLGEYRPKFRKVMPVEYRRALGIEMDMEMERMRMGDGGGVSLWSVIRNAGMPTISRLQLSSTGCGVRS
jgi:glutamate synthase (NADPH/NADH) large chain